jgi:hypothetical protein
MKKVYKKISPMSLIERFNLGMRLWRVKQQREHKDYAREMRKENLYNHVKKDMMSENLYILICTVIYSLILFSFCVIAFLLACNLSVKILL